MILDDVAQVVYAPVKAFKRIIENPKYLGAFIILILFIGLQFGYEYVQFAKTQVENTSPSYVPPSYLAQSTNSSFWTNGPGVTLSNNHVDFYNYTVSTGVLGYYYNLFTNYSDNQGPSSLEIDASNTSNASASLENLFNVNCAANGFQNLSITLKLVSPQTVPQNATLTLYSLNDSNYYTYQLTSSLSTASLINVWQNLTIPLGPSSQGWTTNSASNWSNITAVKLDFYYPSNSNITIRIGALFFRGQNESYLSIDSSAPINILEAFSLQFIFTWLLLTGLIYLFFKGFKVNMTWKPLFVSVAFAMLVLVIRALISFLASFTLPTLYFPYDATVGITTTIVGDVISYPSQAIGLLSMQSHAAVNAVLSATAGLQDLSLALFIITYVWLGYLCTTIISQLNPSFSMAKRISIAGVSIAVTIFLLLLLGIPI